ncbi:MAG TPA: hypothetical protein VMV29_16515 [Ktedonobacterales bacterium]|nr:hypothetical protein [Ktedonobacterales bacterium]
MSLHAINTLSIRLSPPIQQRQPTRRMLRQTQHWRRSHLHSPERDMSEGFFLAATLTPATILTYPTPGIPTITMPERIAQ